MCLRILTLVLLYLFIFVPLSCFAEVVWDAESSTYNGTFFESNQLSGSGATQDLSAFGLSVNDSGIAVFGLINRVPISSFIFFPLTELNATALSAGTRLVLEFSKEQSDKVNFVGILAQASDSATDVSNDVKLEILSDTRIRISATIVDPVGSSSGDANAAFGLIISTADNADLDFKSAVFVTDMHFLDLGAPASVASDIASIRANGLQGTTGSVYAYLPQSLLDSFGVMAPDQVQGFIDQEAVPSSQFTNYGILTNLGFELNDSTNPTNAVLKAKLSNSDWSPHDIQFGVKSGSGNDSGDSDPRPVPGTNDEAKAEIKTLKTLSKQLKTNLGAEGREEIVAQIQAVATALSSASASGAFSAAQGKKLRKLEALATKLSAATNKNKIKKFKRKLKQSVKKFLKAFK